MDIEKERQRFESVHQKPDHCIWCGSSYAATEYNAWSANEYAHKWLGWISCVKYQEKV